MTNSGVTQPAEGFHPALRRLVSESGALLVIDETHTLVAGPGGLTARWWRAHRLYNRSGYTHGPELPTNALEARARSTSSYLDVLDEFLGEVTTPIS